MKMPKSERRKLLKNLFDKPGAVEEPKPGAGIMEGLQSLLAKVS
jgi:hypothetical protein